MILSRSDGELRDDSCKNHDLFGSCCGNYRVLTESSPCFANSGDEFALRGLGGAPRNAKIHFRLYQKIKPMSLTLWKLKTGTAWQPGDESVRMGQRALLMSLSPELDELRRRLFWLSEDVLHLKHMGSTVHHPALVQILHWQRPNPSWTDHTLQREALQMGSDL